MTAGGSGGGFDELLSQMGMLQQQLSQAEERIGRQAVEGTAGGGAVVIRASGELSFDSVRIDPAVVEAGDVSVLEDLVLAAVRDAATKLGELRREAMGVAVSGALGGLFGTIGELGDDDLEDDDLEDDLDEDELEEAELVDDDEDGAGPGSGGPSGVAG